MAQNRRRCEAIKGIEEETGEDGEDGEAGIAVDLFIRTDRNICEVGGENDTRERDSSCREQITQSTSGVKK